MILKEIYDLISDYKETIEEMRNLWASEHEIKILESQVKFKIDVILNGINYKLMQQ